MSTFLGDFILQNHAIILEVQVRQEEGYGFFWVKDQKFVSQKVSFKWIFYGSECALGTWLFEQIDVSVSLVSFLIDQ